MTIEETIDNLLQELHRPQNRGIGRTRAALELARTTNADLLVFTMNEAWRLRKQGVVMEVLGRPLYGRKKPLVVDPATYDELLIRARRRIRTLENKTKELDRYREWLEEETRYSGDLLAEIYELKNETPFQTIWRGVRGLFR